MIGIDIVDIKRFSQVSENDYASWSKVFTKAEWEYCFKKPKSAQHLAGTFAAKEAVMKALGSPSPGCFNRVEITRDKDGAPNVAVTTPEEHGVSISVSHDGKYAVAAALLLR